MSGAAFGISLGTRRARHAKPAAATTPAVVSAVSPSRAVWGRRKGIVTDGDGRMVIKGHYRSGVACSSAGGLLGE